MRGFGMLDVGKTGWVEKPDPQIKKPTDVLIRTTAVAMCTSDVHNVRRGLPSLMNNIIGHEAVGVVEAVGSAVKDFKVGDRVALGDYSPVAEDYYSQIGLPNYSEGGSRTLTPWLDGGFSEYILFERADTGLAHIPDNVTELQGLMCIDMVATAATAVEAAKISFGDSVAVIGIGPVGLCAIELAAISGAGKIIGIGGRKACRDMAVEMGASTVINYRNGNLVEQVIKANGGKHVDKVVICGGYAGVLEDALNMVRPGGAVTSVAAMPALTEPIPVGFMCDKTFIKLRAKTGRYFMESLMQLIANGRIHPEKVISHVYNGFEAMPQAFEKMSNKTEDLIKTVCVF